MANTNRPLSEKEVLNGTIGALVWASASLYNNYLTYLDSADYDQKKALSDFNSNNFIYTPFISLLGVFTGIVLPGFNYVIGGVTVASGAITAFERIFKKRERKT